MQTATVDPCVKDRSTLDFYSFWQNFHRGKAAPPVVIPVVSQRTPTGFPKGKGRVKMGYSRLGVGSLPLNERRDWAERCIKRLLVLNGILVLLWRQGLCYFLLKEILYCMWLEESEPLINSPDVIKYQKGDNQK